MGIFSKISGLFRGKDAQSIIDDLEDILLESGLSPQLVYQSIDMLDKRAGATSDPRKIIEVLKDILLAHAKKFEFELPSGKTDAQIKNTPHALVSTTENATSLEATSPHVYMFVGVNGVGKTTSIAKFVYYLMHTHHVKKESLVVAAGDTFRAGAIEQIEIHCNNLGVALVKQTAGADPAAVLYDTLTYAKSRQIPYIIADTAGRMNNRKDLIDQLKKIYRILQQDIDLSCITTFIVLDGNSGLNTLAQIEDFKSAVPIDAVILSKYDGSAKGGTLLSIAHTHGIPCAFLGVGEKYQDLIEFSEEEFLDEFLSH